MAQKDPAGHGCSASEPDGQKEPSAQATLRDASGQYVPAGQGASSTDAGGQKEPENAHTALTLGVSQ